jgi:integrase
MHLTSKRIERLHEPGRYRDNEVRGLLLQVRRRKGSRKAVTASWVLRYERNGVEHMIGLGSLSEVNLNQAREAARAKRRELRDGTDPLATRAADRQRRALRMSFQECAAAYIERNKVGWKNPKHIQQWSSTMRDWVYPIIGALPVSDIDTPAIMKVLTQEPKGHPSKTLWNVKPETASRVRGRVERILDAAKVLGAREGDNPARFAGHLANLLPRAKSLKTTRHHPALPFADLPGFIAKLQKQTGVGPLALEFCILNAARTGEIVGAQWSEIDFKNRVWTVPAARMKAKREHRVPLSDRAMAILRSVPRFDANPFIFPSPMKPRVGLSSAALMAAMNLAGDYKDKHGEAITVHGFRSTFKDWSRETTAFPSEVAEAALGHIVGDKVEAAYARGDLFVKRAKMMAAWATYCLTPVRPAKVVPMTRRAAR